MQGEAARFVRNGVIKSEICSCGDQFNICLEFFHLFKPKAIPMLPTCGRCITVNPHISNSFLSSTGTFLANNSLNPANDSLQSVLSLGWGSEVLQMSPSHPVSVSHGSPGAILQLITDCILWNLFTKTTQKCLIRCGRSSAIHSSLPWQQPRSCYSTTRQFEMQTGRFWLTMKTKQEMLL